jgi:asparagine synthase (glutamine-hydrolysing)
MTLTDYGSYKLPDQPSQLTLDEAAEQLDVLLLEATRIRLRSDVPLGAFLSGGLDSSAVVSYMQRGGSGQQVKTYAMGFEDASFDERRYARMVADALGSDHQEEIVTPVSQELLQDIVWHLDEPFADSSSIPTYLVSQAARRHVTVALSGDGGDELFAGYRRYDNFYRMHNLTRFPRPVRRLTSGTLKLAYNSLPESLTPHLAADWMRRIARAIDISFLPPTERVSVMMNRHFSHDDKLVLFSPETRAALADTTTTEAWLTAHVDAAIQKTGDPIHAYMFVDATRNLPGDMLFKVDRMSMAHGLEVRCPLLDQEVVAFVLSLPREYKFDRRIQKILLRRVMADRLPPAIMQRAKMGFGVPLGPWLTTTFRPLVEDCLSPESTRRRGVFAVEPVLHLRNDILRHPTGPRSGLSQYQRWHRVWIILMFELWARRFLDVGS